MKRLKIGVIVSVLFMLGCQSTPGKCPLVLKINKYPFYETYVNNLPATEDVVGIFIMVYPPDTSDYLRILVSIGNTEKIYRCTKFKHKADMVETDESMILPIVKALKKAPPVNGFYGVLSDAWIALLTKNGAYMVALEENREEHFVYGKDYMSSELWYYLKTIGALDVQINVEDEKNLYLYQPSKNPKMLP